MSLFFFQTTEEFWSQPDVANAVLQAQDAARRIAKTVTITRDQQRLATALQVIDGAVRVTCPNPRVLTQEQAVLVLQALPRIGVTRLPFLQARPGNDGEASSPGFVLAPIPFQTASIFRGAELPAIEPQPLPSGLPELSRIDATRRGKNRLIRAIAEARIHGRPVPIGASRHGEIATALRTYLHTDTGPASSVTLVYSDGSQSGKIRVAAHAFGPQPDPTREIALGLNSCRHFDLDRVVDRYLLRTTEFERREDTDFANQEAIAHARATELLGAYRDEILHLRLYHTGLEPGVVGAYRAVIDRLLDGQKLLVTPVFFPGGPEQRAWW